MSDSPKVQAQAARPASALQYAYRSQNSIGIVSGDPTYAPLDGFDKPEGVIRTYTYSPDGRMLACAFAGSVRILDTATTTTSCSVVRDLPVTNVADLQFSPRDNFLSTWERPVKLEDGSMSRNLKIWDTQTGEELASYERRSLEGWQFQFTADDKYALRMVSSEIQVYDPRSFREKGVVGRLKLESGITSFALSPGVDPAVAVFAGEKKGAPASVKIYDLASLIPSPTTPPVPLSQKTFFKADKIQMKWHKRGQALLCLATTDVDKSNKSYYGETNLYFMTRRGDFDCRVMLDKEGPIHDFDWSPTNTEFVISYGYMPSKTVLFNQRVKVIADLGTLPRNFVSFNPQGRLICVAGFGNLNGTVDVWDRENLEKGKVASWEASNSSVCEWSPNGKFLLTATLSPRLRVDNGVKIWYWNGALMHVEVIEELYQASWRPTNNEEQFTLPKGALPSAPQPSPTVALFLATKSPAPKPAGVYRPPGARGSSTPSIFKREDEAGSGTSTPTRPGPASQQNGKYVPGAAASPRRVPGAPPPGGAAGRPGARGEDRGAKGKKKGGAGGAKKGDGAANGQASPAQASPAGATASQATAQASGAEAAEATPVDKRLRNLNKKIKAIEELKEKQKKGEKLELTQLEKIKAEAQIRKEIDSLGNK